ncbi:MAG: endopeptidase La [Gammaproteobacteria bacterium]|nr:endopeptidase La [Gammaproteobacteria bacterium]
MFEFCPRSQSLLSDDEEDMAAPAAAPKSPGDTLKPLPEDALILLPVRNLVLFPGTASPLTIGRASSVAAARAAAQEERAVGLLLQRDPAQSDVQPDDLHWVGTTARILRYVAAQGGAQHLVVQGERRFRVLEFLEGWPFLVARVAYVEPGEARTQAIEARLLQLKQRAGEAIRLLPNAPDDLMAVVQNMQSAAALADMVASFLDVPNEEKQAILETFDLAARLDRVLAALSARVEVLRLSKEIGDKTRQEFDQRQREHVLREQLRQIQKELNQGEDGASELDALRASLEGAGMPPEVLAHATKELRRLERMGESSGEASMVRSYLELLGELPWREPASAPIDIGAARRILDEDHFGLDKIKRRILEFLAVRKLNPAGRAPILCFVGPPGVGKTSLGQSIARATGRPFQRVPLGGVHDEAEIRGHRRTYIGALPGNIVQAVKRAGARDAVLLFDEVDKLGQGGFHGDPAAALLEVLDPAQNDKFRDNYLGVDFDLSKLLFIATANQLDAIPAPLRDRMEVIQLPGYTQAEKLEIARRHLLPRQRENCGLGADQVSVPDAALERLVAEYTREAGVRNLEREIGAVLRHCAMRVAEGESGPLEVEAQALEAILGAPRFDNEVALRAGQPGVATGLAWTPVGGDILFIEANQVPGSGKLILTGQLGEVMKESAQAALTLVKTHLERRLDEVDLHVHVPAGATPKDGPSAGVAIYLALRSLLTGVAVRNDVAMTGEISLRGLVLPIGGVKEKVLAALRAGITTVLLPTRNRKDLEEVPAEARDKLRVEFVSTLEDAARLALDAEPGTSARAA